ncbi:hypothetical protein [Flavobacterium sp.]|uniref:hypothetical protein n=1 Tax=Flavobacterium sp. TaxID=239 RepID=UPI0028BF10A6|nr:hypothetical protein [Flavobacterium sp.]
MTNTELQTQTDSKNKKLVWSIILDLVGYASYGIPLVAELTDVFWAPIAGFVLARMYKGTVGTIGGLTVFVEELLPGVDFIPTFTLTWIYTYLIKKEENK